MKIGFLYSVIILAIIAFLFSCKVKAEAFDNTGALIQLESTHVPDDVTSDMRLNNIFTDKSTSAY